MSCRRNAFIMLYNCDQQRAVEYLGNVIDQVGGFPESLQLVIIELIRKVCRTTPSERVRGPAPRHAGRIARARCVAHRRARRTLPATVAVAA